MKKIIHILNLGLIVGLILTSCEPEDKPEFSVGFSVEFSNGTVINEKDISFYDSSTCILFLKDSLYLNFGFEGDAYIDFTEFSIFVDNDIIYKGIIYPDIFCAASPVPIYISSMTYPTFESDIIRINYFSYYKDSIPDPRNDERIITALEKNGLLHHGISCEINNLALSSDNNLAVICTVTIKNHDNVNYYIPDPAKMGAEHFSYFTGGLNLLNKETNEYYYPSTDNATSEWNDLTMDDLSILESNSEVTYTFESLYNSSLKKGLYDCNYSFSVLRVFWANTISIPLNQQNGRIWVGDIYLEIDDLLVE